VSAAISIERRDRSVRVVLLAVDGSGGRSANLSFAKTSQRSNIIQVTSSIKAYVQKKLSLELEGVEEFFLTSNPCIDVRIRDFSDSPDSSCWRNDVHRFLMHQAVWL
jgi:hypothetical protein